MKLVSFVKSGVLCFFSILSLTTNAQLTIYSENFDALPTGLISQNTATGGWLASSTSGQLTDGCFSADGFTCGCGFTYCVRNVWTIYNGGSSPLNAISGRSAGISGWDGNLLIGQFNYWTEAATTRWIKHSLNFSGYKDVNIAFKWKCTGEASGSTPADYGSVHLSTNNGTTWASINTGGNGNSGKYYGLSTTQNSSLDLSSTYDNVSSVLVAFKWTSNSNALGDGPTFVFDNLVVTGCPLGGTISPISTTFVTSGSTTLTISGVVPGASYQWQSSLSSTGPWVDIAGATSATYTTPVLTETTYYRCKVYAGTCDPSYQNSPAVVTISTSGCTPAQIFANPTDVISCENSPIQFAVASSGTAPISYQWQLSTDGATTWNNINSTPYVGYNTENLSLSSATLSSNGYLYRCIATNSCGADTSISANSTIHPIPIVFAGNDTLIEPNTSAFINASAVGGTPPYSFNWMPESNLSNPDSSYTIAFPTNTTNYTIYVTDNNGCIGSDEVIVNVNTTAELIIPNVFTPNNDGINDLFVIQAAGVQEMKVNIFNRWGNPIASYDGLNNNWDGKATNGSMVDDGTYYYVIDATDLENKHNYFQGSVTLFSK